MSDTTIYTGPAIFAEQLEKKYGKNEAVKSINFLVQQGEIFGFLGPNGAGKTTTLKMLVGLIKPTSGRSLIMGHDIQKDPIAAKKCLGFVPDTPNLYGKLTGREFLRFMGRIYRVPPPEAERRMEELLHLFDLVEVANDLIETYSHGTQQKIALTGALIHEPQVLFLDEPTVGLDPKSARLIKDILGELRRRGRGVILSTHILEIAERLCDRVAIISKGEIIAMGTLAELRSYQGQNSLEDIFLSLTGGSDYSEIARILS